MEKNLQPIKHTGLYDIKERNQDQQQLSKTDGFSYEKLKVQQTSGNNKTLIIRIVVYFVRPSRNGNEKHGFFDKNFFKISDIQAMLA